MIRDYFSQLCGAVGLLKSSGVDLDYDAILEEIQRVAALYVPGGSNAAMIEAARPLWRKYRDMCLEHRLINPGELFNWHDIHALCTK